MLALLDLPFGAHAEAAAAGFVGGEDGGRLLDQHAAGREIRAGHVLQQVGGGRVRDCWISWMAAAQISPALCGGIEVAMPTAMPAAPLASRFGNAPGSTIGSLSSPS